MALILAASTFSQSALADRWVDTKTGQTLPSFPVVQTESGSPNPEDHFRVVLPGPRDSNRAYDPKTGRNFARDACGNWIDTKTGKRLPSFPVVQTESGSPNPEDHFRVVLPATGDRNRAYDPKTGQNFAREPCPPRTAAPRPTPQTGMMTPIRGPTLYACAQLGGSWSTTTLSIPEPFSIDSSGVAGGGCLGLGFNIPNLPATFGVQGTFLGLSNSRSAIFTPTDERFTTGIRSMETVDFVVTPQVQFIGGGTSISLMIGPAWGQVTASSPDASVTQTLNGWSGGIGVSVPVAPNMMAGVLWRHYKVRGDVPLFGADSSVHVDQRGDVVTGTITYNFGPIMSDIRLKQDIVPVGRLENGIGLYRYRYTWSDQVYVGVMAQEVAEIFPAAVVRGPDGYLRVDYGRLGLRLMTWNEWVASRDERLPELH